MKKPIGISMTEGAPWRHTVRFAVPVLLGALLQQLYSKISGICHYLLLTDIRSLRS